MPSNQITSSDNISPIQIVNNLMINTRGKSPINKNKGALFYSSSPPAIIKMQLKYFISPNNFSTLYTGQSTIVFNKNFKNLSETFN